MKLKCQHELAANSNSPKKQNSPKLQRLNPMQIPKMKLVIPKDKKEYFRKEFLDNPFNF